MVATPAMAQVPADGERRLPVPAVTIYPGDIIQESMLTERSFLETTRWRHAVVESPRALIGKSARRTLLPSRPIPLNAVEDAKVVTRGVPTRIVFEEEGLNITTLGSPLQSGSVGEFIRVRNLDSGLTILARVQEDGTLRVGAK